MNKGKITGRVITGHRRRMTILESVSYRGGKLIPRHATISLLGSVSLLPRQAEPTGEFAIRLSDYGKSARPGSGARTGRTRAISRLTTTRLLDLVKARPLKAILESGANRQALRENQARTATADAACSVLLRRVLRAMARRGAPMQTCRGCHVFARLTLQDAAGCPRAGLASCLGRKNTARSPKGAC